MPYSCARAGNRRLDGCGALQSRVRGDRGHKRDDDGGPQAACNLTPGVGDGVAWAIWLFSSALMPQVFTGMFAND